MTEGTSGISWWSTAMFSQSSCGELSPKFVNIFIYHMCLRFKGLRPILGDYCHNARGYVRNRKWDPKAVRPSDLTYCSHKPACIVTTNPDRSVLITIITWHFQFHVVNVSILHLKYKYGAQSESHFACYSHRYVTWWPVTTAGLPVIGAGSRSTRTHFSYTQDSWRRAYVT